MKKHKHEAIIKEWLDQGCPPLESKAETGIVWSKCSEKVKWHCV